MASETLIQDGEAWAVVAGCEHIQREASKRCDYLEVPTFGLGRWQT